MNKRAFLQLIFGCGAAFCFTSGCMESFQSMSQTAAPKPAPPSPADDAPIESQIVRVNKFFSSNPWLNFEGDGTNRIDGIRFTVYLEGPNGPSGVFGTGRMIVTMFRIDQLPDGSESVSQIYDWDLPPEKAYAWRAKKKTAMGWGYGIRLNWDKNMDLSGKQIAIIVKYIREDKSVVTSSRQVLKVPRDGRALPEIQLKPQTITANELPRQKVR